MSNIVFVGFLLLTIGHPRRVVTLTNRAIRVHAMHVQHVQVYIYL